MNVKTKKDMTMMKVTKMSNIEGTKMEAKCFDYEKIINVNFEYKDLWGGYFEGSTIKFCNFKNTDLTSTDLTHVTFIKCDFTNTIMRKAYCRLTTFLNCTFKNTVFNEAIFSFTSFISCKLMSVALKDIDCFRTKFEFCQLHNTEFSGRKKIIKEEKTDIGITFYTEKTQNDIKENNKRHFEI